VALAAVFDGHNGDAAAVYCRERLAGALCDAWAKGESPMGALTAAFLALNDGFLRNHTADDSGCTALAALVVAGRLHVANAGDCQCCLWRGDSLQPLSRVHTASCADERARVEALGGEVRATADGKERLQGVIQVTRCIGDRPLRDFGLTAEPNVRTVELVESDRALVVASDGLWDVVSPERVLHCLVHTAWAPDLIAKRLVAEAIDGKSDDNITVVVALLRD